MKKKTLYSAYIKIHDFDCSVEELTEKIGIKPDISWQKGDKVPNRNTDIKRKFSSWALSSGKSHTAPIDDHIDALISLIKPRYKIFKTFIKKFNGEFTIVIKSSNLANVGLTIKNDKLKFFTQLGAAIDIDIYFLNSE